MKILVVDDDLSIAESLTSFLQSEGFPATVAAGSAAQAREAIFASGGVDLLVTDVMMEGEDGFTLREKLLTIFPTMKTVFLSEYDLSDYQDRIANCPLLAKPVDEAALLRLIKLIALNAGETLFPPQSSTHTPAQEEAAPAAEEEPATPTPKPVPVATPRPVPVATPRPVASQPVAEEPPAQEEEPAKEEPAMPSPKPVPVATPRPVPSQPVAEEPPAQEKEPAKEEPAIPSPKPVPVATPRPVPVATPRPVPSQPVTEEPPAQEEETAREEPVTPSPKPVPVATPRPVPVATPRPVAEQPPAQEEPATPSPRAVPTATPRAVSVASPKASATPSAQPKPTEHPKPTPSAKASIPSASPARAARVKVVTASAAPVAKASPAAKPAAKPAPSPEIELPPDSLVGRTLANYQIEAKIGEGPQGGIYRALQTNMDRKVRLYTFDPNAAGSSPGDGESFVSNASVKASVRQPYILSVYEAGESEGIRFYSSEYIPARSLAQMQEKGQFLDGRMAFVALKMASEALGHLASSQIKHNLVTDKSILISGPGKVRLANIAAKEPSTEFDESAEIRELGRIVLGALDPKDDSVPGLRELLTRQAQGDPNFSSWRDLKPAIEAVTPKTEVRDSHMLDARETAARKAIDEAKLKQKRSLVITAVSSVSLFLIALGILYWAFFLRGGHYKSFDQMVEIPAGPFIYQDGETVNLPRFWISEHPVTIGQYSEFVEWVNANPDKIASVAHANAPSGKTYIPEDWADQDLNTGWHPGYFTRAKRWGRYRGGDLNLNSPVFNVDFFDAYAYAKWRGQRLPTEQEWEKAARGSKGNLYPWGNEPDPAKANTGFDFDPTDPEKGGHIDGWRRWSPVDAKRADQSEFGVMGMAGNVSEWTGTWEPSDRFGGMEVPVIRGGNWQNPDHLNPLTRRILLRMPEQFDMNLGFRTVSDQAPD